MNTSPLSPDRAAWRKAVAEVAAKASEKMPDSISRINAAVKLALAGDVDLLPDGGAMVASRSKAGTEYFVVNGTCECADFARAPGNFCAHRRAYGLVVRANELTAQASPVAPVGDADTTAASTLMAPEVPTGIDPRHLVYIQGRPYVRYAGLLELAHKRGLASLTAEWTFNSDELSLAHAVATFADGRRFEESGDATPANTNRKVAGHFRRVALTRAKARVLRDALGIDLVALEELGSEVEV
jgi:hypothetical protein